MSYATVADLRLRITSDRYNAIYSSDDEANTDLATAEAEVELYLQARYQVPVTVASLHPMLKSWVLTLAEELVYSRNIQSDENTKIRGRVEHVRTLLQKIATGEMKLSGVAENVSPAGGAVLVKGDTPVMTETNLRGY